MLDNLETKSKPDKVLNCYPYSVTPKQLEQFTSIVGLPKILTKVLTDTYYYDEEQNILHYINPESQVQEKICVNDDNKKQFEQICSKVANYMLNCIGRGHNNVISIHKKDPDVLYGTYDLNSIMNIQLYLNSNKVEVMRNVFLYSII